VGGGVVTAVLSTPLWTGLPPAGVVVDLNDTLYPQSSYLDGAAWAVGRAAGTAGLDGPAIERALRAELAAGSDRGGTIDRALAGAGVSPAVAEQVLPMLVAAFTSYRPATLPTYDGVPEALAALRRRYPLALLTDGDPGIQRGKLAATGLAGAFDTVIVTDAYGGRAVRKPHPRGLHRVASLLHVRASELVVVGDRPTKDVAVAAAVGARAIRVRSGEFAHLDDVPGTTVTVPDFVTAAAVLLSG
jgi:putative hydrolase of the HAD superfamily